MRLGPGPNRCRSREVAGAAAVSSTGPSLLKCPPAGKTVKRYNDTARRPQPTAPHCRPFARPAGPCARSGMTARKDSWERTAAPGVVGWRNERTRTKEQEQEGDTDVDLTFYCCFRRCHRPE